MWCTTISAKEGRRRIFPRWPEICLKFRRGRGFRGRDHRYIVVVRIIRSCRRSWPIGLHHRRTKQYLRFHSSVVPSVPPLAEPRKGTRIQIDEGCDSTRSFRHLATDESLQNSRVMRNHARMYHHHRPLGTHDEGEGFGGDDSVQLPIAISSCREIETERGKKFHLS